MKILRKVLSACALVMVVFSIYGYARANSNARGGNCKEQMPLHGVQGIIVNASGIYVGLGYYSRIQKYDHQGNYIDCWKTKTYSKDYSFSVGANGQPEIINRNIARDQTNRLLNSKEINEDVKNIIRNSESTKQVLNPNVYIDKEGVIYAISEGFYKRLIKITNENEEVIIEQGLFQNLISGYKTPWYIGLMGVFTLLIVNLKIIEENFSKDLRNFSIVKAAFIKTAKDIFK